MTKFPVVPFSHNLFTFSWTSTLVSPLSFCVSGCVLVRTTYSILASDAAHARLSLVLCATVAAFHVAVAVSFKLYLFEYAPIVTHSTG